MTHKYSKQIDRIMPEPEPKEDDFKRGGQYFADDTWTDWEALRKAKEKWLSSGIEIVGEHSHWTGGEVEGKDFEIHWQNSKGETGKEFTKVALYEESIKEFDAWFVAIPIKQQTKSDMEQEKRNDFEKPMFYIRSNETKAIVAIHEIEPDEHRKGWLRGRVVDVGNDVKSYIGADYIKRKRNPNHLK